MNSNSARLSIAIHKWILGPASIVRTNTTASYHLPHNADKHPFAKLAIWQSHPALPLWRLQIHRYVFIASSRFARSIYNTFWGLNQQQPLFMLNTEHYVRAPLWKTTCPVRSQHPRFNYKRWSTFFSRTFRDSRFFIYINVFLASWHSCGTLTSVFNNTARRIRYLPLCNHETCEMLLHGGHSAC